MAIIKHAVTPVYATPIIKKATTTATLNAKVTTTLTTI